MTTPDAVQALTERITAVMAAHRFDGYMFECRCQRGLPDAEAVCMDRDEHEAHVAAVLIAELGLTQEFAVCIEGDGEDKGVFLYGDHRWLRRDVAEREVSEMPRRFEMFVGTAWSTRWERAQ